MKTYTNNAVVWLKKDKNGKTFLSFKAERDIKEGESINLFKNDKGDNPKRPDYRSYEVEEEKEESQEFDTEKVASDVPF